jgi:hypothetical protein
MVTIRAEVIACPYRSPLATTIPRSQKQMELTPLQRSIIAKIAKAEFRTTSQMISLLLAEGIRFYFCDNDARFGNIKEDELVKQLEQEAALESGHLCFDED